MATWIWKKRNTCILLVAFILVQTLLEETAWKRNLQKNKNRTSIWSSNYIYGNICKGNKITNSKRYPYFPVHSHVIYKSQGGRQPVYTDGWMNKACGTHTHTQWHIAWRKIVKRLQISSYKRSIRDILYMMTIANAVVQYTGNLLRNKSWVLIWSRFCHFSLSLLFFLVLSIW